ncbi:tetratricopeptide repeat protein [Hymenobacter jejuensis]|uniref:tetratricopeptide repeat protein n=1 Tax=Hymenobacter jejuensis TaxID=2502781 RepID=UPI0013FCF471|nr:tetratricopeptide repeat protein [Hymenobacter jejuensis]
MESELRYGNEYLANKNYTYASWRYETVVLQWPAVAEGHLRLGQCYVQLGKAEKARTELAKAVELNPAYRDEANGYLAQLDAAVAASAPAAPASPGAVNPAPAAAPAPAVRASPATPAPTGRTVGGPLLLGVYACDAGHWDVSERRMKSDPKGALTLGANGQYQYMGQAGKYSYNAATGGLTFLSGYFTKGSPTTAKFSPGERVAQVDITFQTSNGKLEWSCGCNHK